MKLSSDIKIHRVRNMQTEGPALLEFDFLTSNSVKTKLAEFCFWIQNHKDPGPRRKAAHSSGDLLMALHSDTEVLIRTQAQYLLSMALMFSHSVVSNILQPHGPKEPARLFCPWDFPAKILERAAISSCRGYSQPRDQTHASYCSCTAGRFFTTEPRWKPCHLCNHA